MKAYPASLYIHIPFCKRKCDYCDFYSICDSSIELDLLEQIPRQIELLKKQFNLDLFKTVYLGGGTPGLIGSESLSGLLLSVQKINKSFLPSEITLECNPSNVTVEKMKAWKDMGITRISLGVQSFQDVFLKKAGRLSSRELILKALTLLKEASCFELNIDLIQGLPGMRGEDQLKDLEEALSWKPDHISWYSLILENGTVLEDSWEDRNGSLVEDNDLSWESGCLFLENAGYERYEISNFCREGKKSLHNSSYWKLDPYLGCGPSAVSMLKDSSGLIRRFRTRADALNYSRGKFEYEDCESITSIDFLKDYLLMGLRLSEGIHLQTFEGIFGKTASELFPCSLKRWIERECLIQDCFSIRPSSRGMNLLNSILISIFEELDEQKSPLSLRWPSE
ncbi:radical SAM family heme chaperone HemW [Oceanispirochaeta sp.]|uniref:radical SAM family heme chaperone HemW n=1 Tax=Oceanispirochaeta sp. TaxID=2035350 RepID=UPI00261FEA66|nr:radical SAM family heme chaperone HemW [Oceanispirochaeta sp.]MDA3957731.1 radical SAM family heme chaperone HemW [Oceanispirochaeta sp.]